MSSHKGFKSFQLLFVVLLNLFALPALPSQGDKTDWVPVGKDVKVLFYYNNKSVQIDPKSEQIKVWVKFVWTKKGMSGLNLDKDNISESLCLYYMDYKHGKQYMNRRINYSKSGSIVDDLNYKTLWEDIMPGSISDLVLKKIIRDYNIDR